MSIRFSVLTTFCASLALATPMAYADCAVLPTHDTLQQALRANVKAAGGPGNGGLELQMWATIVDRDGVVCAVAFSGEKRDDQWPGSRVISAQKANTANGFSLKGLAISTANLYSAVQPGGSLYGLQQSNPVNTTAVYNGNPSDFGSPEDPLVGQRIGGINVFGGGLGLYNKEGILGGLGVSGDTSCADHNIAWRVRKTLGLDAVSNGVSKNKDDAIIYDIAGGKSKGGFGHPKCGGKEDAVAQEIKAAG